MGTWRQDVIRLLGGKPTPAAMRLLGAWQPFEGGHTKNSARFNWLNTTRGGQYPGINSVGVRAFPDYRTGVKMTADTLRNYPSLMTALTTGNVNFEALAPDLNKWLTGRPTPGMSDYVRKIAGSYGSPVTGGLQPSPPPQGGTLAQAPAPAASTPSPRRRVLADLLNQESEMLRLPAPQMLIDRLMRPDPAAELDATRDGGTTRPPVNPQTKDLPGFAGEVSPKMKKVLELAHAQIGKPYVWGAESPAEGGFDCSGLIDWAFKQAGIPIPGRLTTWTAAKLGRSVRGKPLQPGDWIISNGGKHMTMYVGGGKVIASPRRGTVVQYQPVPSGIVDVRRYA